jgi:threonyl-tRNA synthetase
MNEELDPNDHRRIGVQQKLFHVQEEAAGSVFWHPNGATLFRSIEGYIRDRLRGEGYQEIKTPQLVDRSLWERSGHWGKFRQNMFVASDAELPLINPDPEYGFYRMDLENQRTRTAIKPMNCPCHVQVFNQRTVSYRQLPLRLAEFGCCHRNEPSGALHGIMRLRQFTQDDAHIFCTEEQVAAETESFCRLLLSVYKDFGFTEVKIGFSTRPKERAGTDETWDKAENALRTAVEAIGLAYETYPGEGAFYGPKLEFALVDIRGRQWQCGTLQLDFVLPERLDAHYTAASGERLRPVMLHRAILGSMERFIGILLEHYEGRLPAWLAPVQYAIVPIKPENAQYARLVHSTLDRQGFRGLVDDRDDHMNNRIKEHLGDHVPFLIVVGDRDQASRSVAVRFQGGKNEFIPLGALWVHLEGQCGRPDHGLDLSGLGA